MDREKIHSYVNTSSETSRRSYGGESEDGDKEKQGVPGNNQFQVRCVRDRKSALRPGEPLQRQQSTRLASHYMSLT